MTTPHFNSEEERKEFWAGWHEVRGTVWNVLKAEGINKPTLEQYFAKGEQLSQEYIRWWNENENTNENHPAEVEEVVTHTPSVTEVSTQTPQPPIGGEISPMEDENLEAPEIEANQTPQPPIGGEITGGINRTHEACIPLQGVGGSAVLKVIICLASIISALFVGGWFMPFVCILPFFGVVAYQHDKMERAMVVHDSPALYQYGTRSC